MVACLVALALLLFALFYKGNSQDPEQVMRAFLRFVILVGAGFGLVFLVWFLWEEVRKGTRYAHPDYRHPYDELRAAKQDYDDALAWLKRRPTDADLKQRTLHFGRVYANLTRNRRGVAIFDEIALMNDINAACAGAAGQPQPTEAVPTLSVEARLTQLSKLKESGFISDQEYAQRRQKILDEI